MKIIADTHAHTLASGHAYSTIKEMAAAAKERGLKALALTEHAPEMPGTCGLFYFQNLDVVPREADGVRLLMGAELNIMDPDGTVDLPEKTCRDLDIVVASIHPPCYGLDHTPEEIAQVIEPQFEETDLETITTIVARYYDQDTWKADLIFEEDSFELSRYF